MDSQLRAKRMRPLVYVNVAITQDQRELLSKSVEENKRRGLKDASVAYFVREALGEYFSIREEMRHGPGKSEGARRSHAKRETKPRTKPSRRKRRRRRR